MSNYKQFSFAKQGTIPTKWISLAELASDGKSPAYLCSSMEYKIQDPFKKDIDWVHNYVYGTYNCVEGYYHMETRAAHAIMYDKFPEMNEMHVYNNKIESNIIIKSIFNLSVKGIQEKLKKRQEWKTWQHDTKKLLFFRAFIADQPSGPFKEKELIYCKGNGAWMYPATIYSYRIGCKMIDVEKYGSSSNESNQDGGTAGDNKGWSSSTALNTVKEMVGDGESSGSVDKKRDDVSSAMYQSINYTQYGSSGIDCSSSASAYTGGSAHVCVTASASMSSSGGGVCSYSGGGDYGGGGGGGGGCD